ncbi:MAG TPA: acetyl-CoA carboxylase biotin carboxylase subunit [Acidobacteriota bacterium]|jgi:acetyl-CoA carboxylase biotin carboxylase subunit
MFKKILVANRGEIAVRILRACREMKITGVAVYSDVDETALHVRMADEAYRIGAAPAGESYLRADRIIETARRCGAEAIHPGYGFLSENAEFAGQCRSAGITFIGPPPEAMRKLGEKIPALEIARGAGVPTIPGSNGAVRELTAALKIALEIGYPVMLKASGGGGGKGMRLVGSEEELRRVWDVTQNEAASSFGNPVVFLEKYLVHPRHIEIQVLADHHGNVLYFPERECSLQRRHQKIVEESPSPAVDPALRKKMGEAAALLASTAGYQNAGTVEFLMDADGKFFFLEMNTRLQVEHPVTEMVTGVDLVHLQIRIAAGEQLLLGQSGIDARGHAVECRIYAEDPGNQFMPSPGTIASLEEPAGPGIRNDTGIYPGAEISLYYDPLISKLIAHAGTRQEALARAVRALREYRISGIRTSIPFLSRLLQDPRVASGRLHTGLVAEILESSDGTEDEGWREALIAAALMYQSPQKRRLAPEQSSWRQGFWEHMP